MILYYECCLALYCYYNKGGDYIKNSRAAKIISGILNTVYYSIIVLSIIILVGFASDKIQGGRGDIYGYRPIVILTESMHPSIKANAVVIGKAVESLDDINDGDIVTFKDDYKGTESLITHRVISIDRNNEYVKTKGDNNPSEDIFNSSEGLEAENILYRVDYIINGVSPIVATARHRPIRFVYISLILLGGYLIFKVSRQLLSKSDHTKEKNDL